jgi:signal transduction histidine kinase
MTDSSNSEFNNSEFNNLENNLDKLRARAAIAQFQVDQRNQDHNSFLESLIKVQSAEIYQLQQEVAHLSQIREDFLSTTSHELRTPLANIKLSLELLEVLLTETLPNRGQTVRDRLNRYLVIAQESCDREIAQVEDLLLLQELNSGRYYTSQSHLNLKVCIDQIIHSLLLDADHIHIEIKPAVPVILIDSRLLRRLIQELLNNACKFSPADSAITLSVLVKEDILGIQVTNLGVEISPQDALRVFDPFYRIPSDNPWQHEGMGLGLALVKQLVTYLSGAIWVESIAQKACFIVEIPLPIDPRIQDPRIL